jgi:hypothetical protein
MIKPKKHFTTSLIGQEQDFEDMLVAAVLTDEE